jgi:hypothetical protein
VGDFLVHQRLRHHADHVAALGKNGIGNGTHEADRGAAIDQANPACGEGFTEGACGVEIDRILAGIGAAEDAQAHGLSFMIRFAPG